MAKYNDDARFLANLIKDKNKMKASIAGSAEVIQVGKRSTEIIEVEVFNIEVKTRDNSGFIIWNRNTWNGAVWNESDYPDYIDVTKRKMIWDTTSRLSEGNYDANIDLNHGDIRLK